MNPDLLSLAGDAIARAKKFGATAADALAVDQRGIDVSVRDGIVEKLEQAEAREVGIRAFIGARSAIIAGSVLDPEGLDRLARSAVEMAKSARPDPHAVLAGRNEQAREIPDLDLAAPAAIAAGELRSQALAAEKNALAVRGVSKSGGADASYSDRTVALATSEGFAASYRGTYCSISASAVAGDGTGMERDYDFSSAHSASQLESAEAIGKSAGERAVRRLNPRKIKSQTLPVIYDPRIASSLVGHLLGAALGSSIAKGTSFLKDRLGDRLFRKGVSIIDDPLRKGGLASRPFDAEGLAARRFTLIDDGVLMGWLLDLRSASQLGLASNGCASRGLSSPPSPSASNAYLAPGDATPEDLIRNIAQGLYLTELIGSGVNIVTGDYSRGASGFWIENGEIAFPVSEITIAGNLNDMFLNLTPASDLEFRRSINAPTCLIDQMTVGGV